MNKEKGNISIHTENIFPIIKKWLYSDKDIFIRELVSNGCDAVSKYKKLVTMGEVTGNLEDEKFKIIVSVDKEKGTLCFSDNGIGMTKDEVEKYITQVAFSGAEDFIEKYKDKMGEDKEIIGHFGLGFYSAFMVASKVQIDTLSYKEGSEAVKWVCEGGTEYEIGESQERITRGTTITLYIDEESKEFLDQYKVREVMEKYCSFLPTEIFLVDEDEERNKAKEKLEKANKEDSTKVVDVDVKGEEGKVEENDEEAKPINDPHPLWLKKPSECTDEEYKDFYKKVFKVYEEPLFWIHLNVDYPFNLKGILYFPKLKNEFELIEGEVKLYNNQVFVADNIKEVIPEFLLLLKGVIDCPDLPLNVSRSFLQNDRDVSRISKHIVKKVADKLKSIFNNEREKYNEFWDDIQIFIKYGCLRDESFYEKIKDIIVFKTINDEHITLKDYLEKAKEKHEKKVFYVSDLDKQSQYVKMFKEYGLDAVILNTTIDNHFISFLEYKENGVQFTRIDSDISEVLKDKDSKEEENTENKTKLMEFFKKIAGDSIKDCKMQALKDENISAMILVSEYSRRMAEMQKQFAGTTMGMNLNEEKTLVINENNPIVKKLLSVDNITEGEKANTVELLCKQIIDLALISNKELDSKGLDDFIKRSNEIMMLVLNL